MTTPVQAAVPAITSSTPAAAFAGEQVCFDTVLSNTGVPGYAPYYRIILPADISLDAVTYLGTGVSATPVGVFPPSPGNQLTDPIIDTPVSGPDGGSFSTLVLPLGSVVTAGPAITLNFCMTINNAAIIGVPLDVSFQPVYALGDTPTGVNGPITGALITDQITPTLIVFDKVFNGSETERTPGPSFQFNFTLTADVASGKTVHNVVISDSLPADLQFVGPVTINGGTGCSVTTSPSTMTPGGNLAVTCTQVTGTNSAQDLEVIIPVYVIDTLDETSCTSELQSNTATLDFEFPDNNAFPQLNAQDQLTAKHLAIQKGASPTLASPGQTITYTNRIQLSDYASTNALIITDILPDGTTFGAHTSLVVGAMTVPITPTATPNVDGTTTLVYDVHAVTGNLASGAVATLTYTATIDQAYQSGAVLAADSLTNTINANYSLTAGGSACTDGSAATVVIVPTVIRKSIVNPKAEYLPGETVTYRLEMDIPSGDTSNVVFEDFFPLPVFDVASLNLTFGTDIQLATPPNTLVVTPSSITRDPATNALRIEWPDVSTTSPQTLAVDIDITVEDEPFADDLFLTNLFVASTENTSSTQASEVKPVQFSVRAPEIILTKGISATTNSDSTISPAPASPVDSDLTNADAGDTVTFVITAENTGGAPAYDVSITDPAVTGLSNCSLVSVTDDSNNPLTFTPAIASNLATGIQLDNPVPANDSAIATVTCDLDNSVSPQEVITNTASANWSSLSGSTVFPTVTDDATITITKADPEKLIESITPNGTTNSSRVTSGDTITYRLNVELPEGTTENLQLIDKLPAGFTYQSAIIDTTGFNGSASIVSTVPTGSVATQQTVTINMAANTMVTADNNASNNTFSVLLTALVDGTEAANSGISASQLKTNVFKLDYTGRTGTIEAQRSTRFIEPQLEINKTMSPDRNRDAGDTITITLAVTNSGLSPAYDILVTDILNDAGVDDDLFDLTSVAEATTPAGYTYNFSTDTVTYASNAGISLASGATVSFTFTARIRSDIDSGSSYSNTANVIGDSQDGVVGGERSSSDTGSDSVSTRRVSATKTVVSSSEAWTAGTDVAIGEIITYQATIRVPEGITLPNGSLITDRLPTDFQYQTGTATIRAVVNTTLTQGGNPISTTATAITPVISGRDMSFNLGALQNNDNDGNIEQIIIEYDVLVLNTARNNAGNNKTNRFRMNYLNNAGNTQSITARRTVTIVEPQLSISKQAQPSSVQGGTLTQFTVVLTNQNITNSTRAWEPVITDQLPADYTSPAVVSATLSRGAVDISACANFTGNLLSLGSSCLAAADRYLAPGEFITLVYSANVSANVAFEKQIINTASAASSSLPNA
ncbi:MAG: DUF11 domain-containing protein, partial [Gammaproteobacteria bacterium]|nr:DUF11 domain-containing protein [Gammaproteobacteria bacterium]